MRCFIHGGVKLLRDRDDPASSGDGNKQNSITISLYQGFLI
jgi:hypothetical protein